MADLPPHQVPLCQSQIWSPSILQVCENQPNDDKPPIQMEFVKDHFELYFDNEDTYPQAPSTIQSWTGFPELLR